MCAGTLRNVIYVPPGRELATIHVLESVSFNEPQCPFLHVLLVFISETIIPGSSLVTKHMSDTALQIPETLPRAQLEARSNTRVDVLVIGAGPTGLACAIEAQRAGFKVIAIDKGCVVNSIFNYPANMTFFTTPELLEIGDIPSAPPTKNPRATRRSNITGRSPSTIICRSRSTSG